MRLKADEASTQQQADEITGLARLRPAPQSGPELPPPSAPDEIKIALGATLGNVTLKIKARQPVNARGTVYQVTREATISGGQVRRDILGVATTKTFTDTTIPRGTVEARYLLTALRAGKTGGTREAVVRLAA